MSVGPPRWTWRSMSSTACWSWDARTTSAWPNPGPGWGHCARIPDPCNTAPGGELAGVRQGAAAAGQPHSLGHAGGARFLASAPDGPEGPTPRLLGRGDRDGASAAPGLWSSVAADRGSAGTGPGERAGSRSDRRDRPEG